MVKGDNDTMSMVMGKYLELKDLIDVIVEMGMSLTRMEQLCMECGDTTCSQFKGVFMARGGLKAVDRFIDRLDLHDDILARGGVHCVEVDEDGEEMGVDEEDDIEGG